MKIIKSFIQFCESKDKDIDDDIQDYVDKKDEYCPRCNQKLDSCKCEDEDYWSMQTAHRVPKGKHIKNKPKQKFESDE